MSRFGLVFVLLLGATAAFALLQPDEGTRAGARPAGVAQNERLTALNGALLYVLLAAIAITVLFIRQLLEVHYVVGLLLIPPVFLKLASTGYRFARYYTRDATYRAAGTPPATLRFLVAPVLVLSTAAVFGTGVELWLFGLRFGSVWVSAHTLSAVLFIAALGAHLFGHLRRSAAASVDSLRHDLAAGFTGKAAVLLSLALGAVLGAASLWYATPFPSSSAGG